MKNLTQLSDAELLRMHTPTADLVLQRRNLRAYESARRRRLAERGRWVRKLQRQKLSVVERADIKYRVMVCDSYLDDYGRNIAALREDIGGVAMKRGVL